MMFRSFPLASMLALLAAVLLLAGCGRTSARSLKLDKDAAHQALEACLTAWKSGEKIESMKERKPPIICGDWDWEAGATLQKFSFVGTESDDGTNLHSKVEVVMLDKYGREVRKSIKYIVGTSPVITVGREP